MDPSHDEPIQRYLKVSGDDLSGYWLDAYGWIACYFAQLEGLSYALIKALGTREDNATFAKLPYQARNDRAKALVCEYLETRGDARLAEEWFQFLTEAKAAAPMRNNILHNPLSVNLALGDQLHDEEVGIVLTHKPGNPVLKLGAVQAFSESIFGLNRRMQDLLTRSKLTSEAQDQP